jgi:hypothetical protein
MSKKDSKKDVSHIEEVDLDAIVGTDGIFDLGKIREKSILAKDAVPASAQKEEPHYDDNEEHPDDMDISLPDEDILAAIEDDLPPLKDEDLLLLEEELMDFEEDDMDEEDEDGEDGAGRKKRER